MSHSIALKPKPFSSTLVSQSPSRSSCPPSLTRVGLKVGLHKAVVGGTRRRRAVAKPGHHAGALGVEWFTLSDCHRHAHGAWMASEFSISTLLLSEDWSNWLLSFERMPVLIVSAAHGLVWDSQNGRISICAAMLFGPWKRNLESLT